MKATKDQIFTLIREYRITLQIPHLNIYLTEQDKINEKNNQTDWPDDYFEQLNINKLPSKQGFLYFSKKGFEVLKEDIKSEFYSAHNRYNAFSNFDEKWQQFLNHADDHFSKIEKARNKKIHSLEKQLQELKKHAQ